MFSLLPPPLSLSLRGRGRGAFKALQSPACFVSLRSVPLRRAPHRRRRRPGTARPGPRPPPRPRAGPAPRVAPRGARGGRRRSAPRESPARRCRGAVGAAFGRGPCGVRRCGVGAHLCFRERAVGRLARAGSAVTKRPAVLGEGCARVLGSLLVCSGISNVNNVVAFCFSHAVV